MHGLSSEKKAKFKVQVYIVYMGENHKWGRVSTQSMHHSMLQGILGSVDAAKESMVYSYRKSFNGFAAMLTEEEVATISEMEEVVSVFPNRRLELQTTRSWDFMGFSTFDGLTPSFDGRNVIIGVIDSGIWPESESFDDKGLGPKPTKWKGICQTGYNFTCNNKIIGARYYQSNNYNNDVKLKSGRDDTGHGTHTASIAAGREVVGANYYGLAKGVARGGAPDARIAVYKVCWNNNCYEADALAAFDDAIADGVDILTISLGGNENTYYLDDPIAIGSFHAMKKGILTIAAAGNSGPDRGSLLNLSPWLVTVAASSTDRKILSRLVLGNGDVIMANAINIYNANNKSYPLIWGGNAANFSAGYTPEDSSLCNFKALNLNKVKGSIVLCEDSSTNSLVQKAGGVGVISPNLPNENFAMSYPFPTARINDADFSRVLEYTKSSVNPKATIMFSETIEDIQAPYIASFSSRGPNLISPDILKPDLSAPGSNILAAWSPVAPHILSEFKEFQDTRRINYNVLSGTSMSCPHVAGVAAYVKATHPSWSPAAIKSALMTTAYPMDPQKHKYYENEFAYGSGHLNPVSAVDPGLVFNASDADYIDFLCKQGYETSTLRQIANDNSVCKSSKPGRAWDLNYPSFSLAIEEGHKIKGKFIRSVTNVGPAMSTYKAIIDVPNFIKVRVKPATLAFSVVGEEKSFTVEVTGPKISQVPIISGSITWAHGVHNVRTPLVVYTVLSITPPQSTHVIQFSN
ncbi:hypothetical protein Lal_00028854 [Lupinus albus]|nr:hypothetical protein Lal_00028854 [Lupinus albus]